MRPYHSSNDIKTVDPVSEIAKRNNNVDSIKTIKTNDFTIQFSMTKLKTIDSDTNFF